jgi:PAS domain S-box-containing protein
MMLLEVGRILAANQAACELLGLGQEKLRGCGLSDLVAGNPEQVERFLRACARSRSLVLGALTFPAKEKETVTTWRAEGAVVRPMSEGNPAAILLRLIPRESAAGQFVALNQQIEELNRQIHRRIRAEAQAREQGEWLRVTLASIGDAVIVTDAQGMVKSLNPVAEKLTGWNNDEAAGHPLPEVFAIRSELTGEPVENPVNKVLERGMVVGLANHSILYNRDGSHRAIDDSAAPIRDARGNILGIVLVFRDVTEQHEAQRHLHESMNQLRQLADAMPQIVWAAQPDGYMDYYNERWYEYTGLPRGEYGHSSWVASLHPDDVQHAIKSYFGCIRAELPYQVEYRLKEGRSGTYRWFLGRALPVRDETGRVVRWYGTCTEIDDTKKASEVQQKQAERLRLLWETAGVLLTSDDRSAMLRGLFAKINRHLEVDCCLHFEVTETGDGLRLASSIGLPEDAERRLARLEFGEGISGTAAMRRRPLVVTHIQESDNPTVAIIKSFGIRAYACSPLIAENRLLGTLSLASRTRDRFDADELEFLETITRYFAMAFERVKLIDQLRDADRRKDEFLATLAHELRNPLAPIRNALQILRLARDDSATSEQARTLMDRQLGQMVRLIDDLLDVSRIARGTLELRKEPARLSEVIGQAIETARPHIDRAGHHLHVKLASEPLKLHADPLRLSQVFANLLNNASKYTEPQGDIWLTSHREGSDAVVSVRDSGVGIPAEMIPHIFDMFVQVNRRDERSQGGLGIGLTLVRRLVEMHGGHIEVSSQGPGLGSEFTVRLPLTSASEETPAPLGSSDQALPTDHVAHRRILVVDDHRDGAESLALMLRLAGNKVQTAYDGLEAVRAAESFRPDIVLLDVGLPKLNGLEAAREIRRQPWSRDMTLIAVTGWGQEEDRRRSLEAGFNLHMVKPVNPAELEQLLAGLPCSSPTEPGS